MACFRWPGSSGCHSISWTQHQINVIKARGGQAPPTVFTPPPQPPSAPPKGAPIGAPPAAPTPPAAPAAPTFTPDSIYNNDVDIAQKSHDTTIGQIGEDERKTKFEFGLDDPTNPFSRAAEQKRITLAAGNRSNTVFGSMSNQIGSGAYQRAIERNRLNDERSMAALRSAYADALERLKRAKTAADTKLEQDKADALKAAIGRSTGN